jgi:hypothetical protein
MAAQKGITDHRQDHLQLHPSVGRSEVRSHHRALKEDFTTPHLAEGDWLKHNTWIARGWDRERRRLAQLCCGSVNKATVDAGWDEDQ